MRKIFNVLIIFFIVAIFCLSTVPALADAGVGIMPGRIQVDDGLLPGDYYQLPSLEVINTGSQAGQFEISLTKMANQSERQPTAEFISWSPGSFYLEPGANQVVALSLSIPVRADPGYYLAYIEAHPVVQSSGGTNVNVAAAAKIYFTVKPANLWIAIANSIRNFFERYQPASYIIPAVIALGLLIFYLSRRLKLQVKVTRR